MVLTHRNSAAPLLGLKQIFLIYSVELSQATQALREPFEFVLSKSTNTTCSWFCLLKQFEKKYGLVFVNYKFEKCSSTVKKPQFFYVPSSVKFKQHFTNFKLFLKEKKMILFKINHWNFKETHAKPRLWTVLWDDLIGKELKKVTFMHYASKLKCCSKNLTHLPEKPMKSLCSS